MSSNAQNEVARASSSTASVDRPLALLRPPDPPVDWDAPRGSSSRPWTKRSRRALAGIGAAPKFGARTRSRQRRAPTATAATTGSWPGRAAAPASRCSPTTRTAPSITPPCATWSISRRPGLRAIGAVVPWFPGIAIGHNERIGWGLTIFTIDAQDLVQETLDPADPERYRVGDGFDRMRIVRRDDPGQGGCGAPRCSSSSRGTGRSCTRTARATWPSRSAGRGASPAPPGIWPASPWPGPGTGPSSARPCSAGRCRARTSSMRTWTGNIGYQATGLAPIRSRGERASCPCRGPAATTTGPGFASLDELPARLRSARGLPRHRQPQHAAAQRPGGRSRVVEPLSHRRILEVLGQARALRGRRIAGSCSRTWWPCPRASSCPSCATSPSRAIAEDSGCSMRPGACARLGPPDGARQRGRRASSRPSTLGWRPTTWPRSFRRARRVEAEIVRVAARRRRSSRGLGSADGARRDLLVAGAFRAAVARARERLGQRRPRAGAGVRCTGARSRTGSPWTRPRRALFNRGPVARPGLRLHRQP